METFDPKAIEANRREYPQDYHRMRWVTPEQARKADQERAGLLAGFPSEILQQCCGTKMAYGALSPGCRICARGQWSCLFINSECNARCFYCPSPQPRVGEPVTNGISFPSPADYIAYLEKFAFAGASISGGEPLLTADRSLRFVSKVKRAFGERLHLWLYTNGILATENILKGLKNAGLDEIRFDLSADRYRLEKLRLAVGLIPTVTVEIPAIPEDHSRLCALLRPMHEAGVDYLNLHQLRCTPHNRLHLIARNYTFLHGPKVTVLESELAALRTIRYALDRGIGLPVHYCSAVYKSRFQQAAHQRRLAVHLLRPYESITSTGALRRLALKTEPPALEEILRALRQEGIEESRWRLDPSRGHLFFHPSLWETVDSGRFPLFVDYDIPQIRPAVSYHATFKEIPLNRKKTVYLERRPILRDTRVPPEILPLFRRLTRDTDGPAEPGALGTPLIEVREGAAGRNDQGKIYEQECIAPGLQAYF